MLANQILISKLPVVKELLTVNFEYYNHFRGKVSEKKIKFYSEEGK